MRYVGLTHLDSFDQRIERFSICRTVVDSPIPPKQETLPRKEMQREQDA